MGFYKIEFAPDGAGQDWDQKASESEAPGSPEQIFLDEV